MRVRIFTLPFSDELGGFDDSPLREFLADKEALEIRERFFVKDERPYWTVLVTYKTRLAVPDKKSEASSGKAKTPKDWRDLLPKEDVPLFNSLREWRGEKAKKEGVPPYIIFTNIQLAEVIRRRPDSLSALGQIEGIGEAKVRKHGPDILGILKGAANDGREAPPPRGEGIARPDRVDKAPEVDSSDNGEVPKEASVHSNNAH